MRVEVGVHGQRNDLGVSWKDLAAEDFRSIGHEFRSSALIDLAATIMDKWIR